MSLNPAGGALLAGALLLASGCASLEKGAPGAGTMRDDIVAIRQFYSAQPWTRDDETGRVNGIMARVYFTAATRPGEEIPKGVFVPGTIRARMYVLGVRPDGSYDRQLAHEWAFTAQQAAAFRVRHASSMGDSYGLVLRWPREVDVAGREIQVEFSYERQDGEVIARRGSRFQVPLPPGQRAPAPPKAAAPRRAPDTPPQTEPRP